MLRIPQLEEVQGLLLQIPTLVDRQERGDSDFAAAVKAWLCELERALESNRLPAAGAVAAARSTLIAAERGTVPPEVVLQRQATRRKVQDATAALALRRAGELAAGAIQRDSERVAEAARMVRQLVALARAKGLLREVPAGEQHTAALRALWRALAADRDLVAATANVEGLVGPHDALVVLDRTLAMDLPSG